MYIQIPCTGHLIFNGEYQVRERFGIEKEIIIIFLIFFFKTVVATGRRARMWGGGGELQPGDEAL